MHQLLQLVAATCLLSAGCIGAIDQPVQPAQDDIPVPVEDPIARVWWWNATVEGLGTPWVSYTPEEPRDSFRLQNTSALTIDVEADGGEVWVWFYPPGCEENNGGERCSYIVRTQNGVGELTIEDAANGNWKVDVGRSDTGYGEVGFQVVLQWWEGPA